MQFYPADSTVADSRRSDPATFWESRARRRAILFLRLVRARPGLGVVTGRAWQERAAHGVAPYLAQLLAVPPVIVHVSHIPRTLNEVKQEMQKPNQHSSFLPLAPVASQSEADQLTSSHLIFAIFFKYTLALNLTAFSCAVSKIKPNVWVRNPD